MESISLKQINCVTLYLVGYIWKYICEAQTHEPQMKKENLKPQTSTSEEALEITLLDKA